MVVAVGVFYVYDLLSGYVWVSFNSVGIYVFVRFLDDLVCYAIMFVLATSVGGGYGLVLCCSVFMVYCCLGWFGFLRFGVSLVIVAVAGGRFVLWLGLLAARFWCVVWVFVFGVDCAFCCGFVVICCFD